VRKVKFKQFSIFLAVIVLLGIFSPPSDVCGGLGRLFKWVDGVCRRVERAINKATPLITVIGVAKEIDRKKRNEAALNKRAEQEKEKGDAWARSIKNRALEQYKDNEISASEMMARYRKAQRVQQYFNERAETLEVLARREGRLHLEKKIIPIAISKTMRTTRIQERIRKINSAFKDFHGKIGHLVAKAVELENKIGDKQKDIIRKAKGYFDEVAKVHNKLVEVRRKMKEAGIHDRRLERLLDKVQEFTYGAAKTARGMAETGYVAGEELKKLVGSAKKQLQIAQKEIVKRQTEIQNSVQHARRMRAKASPVDPVGAIIAESPEYKKAKEQIFDAWLKKQQGSDEEERKYAIGQRLRDLDARWKKSGDPEERRRIEYQMALLNKRLDEIKAKSAEQQTQKQEEQGATRKEKKAVCGPNEEPNAQGVCVCKSGYEPVSGKCLPVCGANQSRNGSGVCVCDSGFELFKGTCVPVCGPNEMRADSGACMCVTGYSRGESGACVPVMDVGAKGTRDFQKLYAERERRRSGEVESFRRRDNDRTFYGEGHEDQGRGTYGKMRQKVNRGLQEMEESERQKGRQRRGRKHRDKKKPSVNANKNAKPGSTSSSEGQQKTRSGDWQEEMFDISEMSEKDKKMYGGSLSGSEGNNKAADESKWYFWHQCEAVGVWCHLNLSQMTREYLEKSKKKKVAGPYNSQDEAQRALCGMMSNIFDVNSPTAVYPGVKATVAGQVFDVGGYVEWNKGAKKYKCRMPGAQ